MVLDSTQVQNHSPLVEDSSKSGEEKSRLVRSVSHEVSSRFVERELDEAKKRTLTCVLSVNKNENTPIRCKKGNKNGTNV